MSERAAPTAPASRELAIDALRGWALAGIAIVNVPWIGFRESLPSMLRDPSAMSGVDHAAALLVEGLFEGRFYPIFSALFGFGTGLLVARGAAVYARRVLALFAFGVLHATLGWYGDVLLNYAFVGVLLGLVARLPARALFVLAGVLLAAAQLVSLRFDDWLWTEGDPAEHLAYVESELRAYRDGTFASITAHRWDEMLSYFAGYNLSYRVNVLAMATLGLAIERTGVHARLGAHRRAIGRLALGALGAGLALGAAVLALPWLYLLAGDVLAAGYALAFLWLALAPRAARWARGFAAVGRTSLTCYLVQTLCFTLFFYGYGLAMYGELGPAEGVLLAVAVYALEATIAMLWLRRFAIGPFEWVWRGLTYLRAPGFRRAP